ncbi:TPA: GIY-YIG nuclease family protein [Pseudomonas putida]
MLRDFGKINFTGDVGNLYYVRLNTPLGKFYKIGFTKMKSVNDRLAFQGTGDEKYIDEVLYFKFHLGALDLEQCLHGHFHDKAAFRQYSADVDMPLPKNGQSELYYDDVLNLDAGFTPEQAKLTRKAVELAIAKRTYSSEVWAKRSIILSNIVLGALTALANTIGWSVKSIRNSLGIKNIEPQLPQVVIDNNNKVSAFLEGLRRDKENNTLKPLEIGKLSLGNNNQGAT